MYTCIQDYDRGSLYGMEKFWAFHHYCGLPKDQDIAMHPRLKELLEGEFRTLESLRKEQARRQQHAGPGAAAAHHHHPHHNNHHAAHHHHHAQHHSQGPPAKKQAAAAPATGAPAPAAAAGVTHEQTNGLGSPKAVAS